MDYPACADTADGFRQRVTQVIGKDAKDNLIPVDYQREDIAVVGSPDCRPGIGPMRRMCI